MPDRELRAQLSRLHQELERTPSVDDGSRGLLVELLDDIQRLLEAEGEDEDGHDSLRERLGDAVRDFEEQHPTLATAIGRIADTLSNLGI